MKIQHIMTIHYSRRDRAGNCYWAFGYQDAETGRGCTGTVSGGESNIRGAILELSGGTWQQNYSCSVIEHPIREFNRMVKDWPYAGCVPADLAAFIQRATQETRA